MSDDAIAMELARQYIANILFDMRPSEMWSGEELAKWRDAYIAGYERGMADARKLVSETIEKEAPERRKLSRIADKENE